MRVRRLAGLLLAGVVAAVGCGDSDDGGGTGGSAGSGTGGSAADAGSVGGSAGSSTGGTVSGGAAGSSTGGAAGSTTGGAAGSTTGGTAGSGATAACVPATCQGKLYQCGDCIDNDGDGKIDVGQDPDCLGPCHNAENTFYGSIPGQAGPACLVDCYFDQDSGSGNDQCNWNHECDPLSVAPNYPPEGPSNACDCNPGTGTPWPCTANTPGTGSTCHELYQKQTEACENFCGPLTPNGCDCFGCCELPAESGKFVWLGSEINGSGSCDLSSVSDPKKCQPCTPVAACLNSCEHCELCLGKTELPSDCFPPPVDGGAGTGGSGGGTGGTGGTGGSGGSSGSGGSCGGQICPAGSQGCGLSCQPPCPLGQFCLTGCCTFVP